MEQFDSKYFSGQGPIFIGPRDAAGKPTGLIFIGDLTEATLTPVVQSAEVIETVTGAGGIGSSFNKSIEYQLSITMRSIRTDHLAQALQASVTKKVAGSVTDQPHTAYLDKFTPLVDNKVSTVVITGAGGTPTYVENTDYVVHADEGMIEFISGGTITDATAVLIDYAYATQDHVSAAPANKEIYLVFSGMNRADNNKQTRCEIYKAKLDPGVLGMIQEEHAEMQITGRVLLDSLRTTGDQFFAWKLEQ